MMLAEKHVQAAIAKLPSQSNAAIRQVRANAERVQAGALVVACDDELAARGSLTLTAQDAERAAVISSKVADLPITDVIELAFRDQPALEEEARILRWIDQQPGISNVELGRLNGKGDLNLVIGHLVYDRFGYFRPFLQGKTQSDILLEKPRGENGIGYRLRPETRAALERVGLFGHGPAQAAPG